MMMRALQSIQTPELRPLIGRWDFWIKFREVTTMLGRSHPNVAAVLTGAEKTPPR